MSAQLLGASEGKFLIHSKTPSGMRTKQKNIWIEVFVSFIFSKPESVQNLYRYPYWLIARFQQFTHFLFKFYPRV
jgi:hypothetical protein